MRQELTAHPPEVDTGDADAIANFVIRIDSVVTLSAPDFILS